MPQRLQRWLQRGRASAGRVLQGAENGFDWLLRRQRLLHTQQTWFELIYDSALMSVRYYGLSDEESIEFADGERLTIERRQLRVPLLLIPPLGVSADAFDLMPTRSLARYLAARGFRTYLVDWGVPKPQDGLRDLKDYADDLLTEVMEKVRAHSGVREVSLLGWSLGGLLGLLHAGLPGKAAIRNIVCIASPIDLRSGGIAGALAAAADVPTKLIRRHTGFRLEQLDAALFNVPGWLLSLAFKASNPVGSVTQYLELLRHLSDRAYVEGHAFTARYLNQMLLYPGGVVRDVVVKVALDNALADGRVMLGDKQCDLRNIQSALLVVAGNSDHIVPPAMAHRLIELVRSRDKAYRLAVGGHLGLLLGSRARQQVWAPTADWLAKRSGHRRRSKSATRTQ